MTEVLTHTQTRLPQNYWVTAREPEESGECKHPYGLQAGLVPWGVPAGVGRCDQGPARSLSRKPLPASRLCSASCWSTSPVRVRARAGPEKVMAPEPAVITCEWEGGPVEQTRPAQQPGGPTQGV